MSEHVKTAVHCETTPSVCPTTNWMCDVDDTLWGNSTVMTLTLWDCFVTVWHVSLESLRRVVHNNKSFVEFQHVSKCKTVMHTNICDIPVSLFTLNYYNRSGHLWETQPLPCPVFNNETDSYWYHIIMLISSDNIGFCQYYRTSLHVGSQSGGLPS